MIRTLPSRRLGFLTAALVFLLDQASKLLILGPLKLPDIYQIPLLPIFNFTYTENRGISLGLLTAGSPASRWLLVALTAAIAIGVVVWLLREVNRFDCAALGLILGGAFGNILDRARLGYVVDFLDLHFGEWRPFMIFNIADVAISCGVVIILARSFLTRDKDASEHS